ncbi:MAG: copper-binding protein [Magnetococcus sp. YQC-3]
MNKRIFLFLLATIAWMVSGTPLTAAEQHNHVHPPASSATAQVKGTLHAVDAQKRTVNIDHPAVPEFKWPAMRMDFAVAQAVNLAGLKPVQPVRFTISKSEQGTFSITEIAPAP